MIYTDPIIRRGWSTWTTECYLLDHLDRPSGSRGTLGINYFSLSLLSSAFPRNPHVARDPLNLFFPTRPTHAWGDGKRRLQDNTGTRIFHLFAFRGPSPGVGGLAVTLDEFHPFSANNRLIKGFINGFRQFPASGPTRSTLLGQRDSEGYPLEG